MAAANSNRRVFFLPLAAVALLAVVISGSGGGGVEAHGKDDKPGANFVVEGRVYCDTCRAGFETSATEYVAGAKVRLECWHEDMNQVQHIVEGVTDGSGTYRLQAEDDHQDEVCEVTLLSSPIADCSEIKASRNRARVLLTHNAGLATNTRFANSLGFLRKEPLPICGSILKQYQLGDEQ